MTKRILIVDGHPILRTGLQRVLAREATWELCGEAGCRASALDILQKRKENLPDIVITEISLPDGSGLDLIKEISEKYPSVKVLVYTTHPNQIYAEKAYSTGASGYINKGEKISVLIEAIHSLLAGRTAFPRELTERMILLAQRGAKSINPRNCLSPRLLQTYSLMGRAAISSQIATELGVRPKTVESHKDLIKTKLGCSNGHQLLIRAFVDDFHEGVTLTPAA